MPELETVDLDGVEILSAGGPVHGIGSPPGGDFWSKKDLEAMADANRQLAAELQPPQKIGHSDAQALLKNSDDLLVTPGEMPAVGWLDGSTFRVEGDGETAKLVADAKDVPKKFAELVKSKAWRTRSVELSKVESQTLKDADGKPRVFEWVITGLAWLGAKLPAVRTLDDVVALYEDAGLEKPDAKVFVVYATGDLAWEPGGSFNTLRDDISAALNGPSTGGMNEPRFWVNDVSLQTDVALAMDYYGENAEAWIIPFKRNGEGGIDISPSSDWTKAEQAWVETAKEYAARESGLSRRRVDSRPMPDTKFTDAQRRKFAEATGVEPDKVTDDMLAKAGVVEEKPDPALTDDDARALADALGVKGDDIDSAKLLEAAKKATAEKPEPLSLADESVRKLESRLDEEADARKKLERKLHEEERDHFIETDAVKAGKIEPGQREFIELMYEADPGKARQYVESLPVQENLVREYGSDEETGDGDSTPAERAFEDDLASRLGVKVEELI